MDNLSFMNGETSSVSDPPLTYDAQVESPLLKGAVEVSISRDSLIIKTAFDIAEIPFTGITALHTAAYTVVVDTEDGSFAFSRMGSWTEPFHDALCGAFNRAVLRGFFVEGAPLLTASGDYSFIEDGSHCSGKAPLALFENCLVVLPPNLDARRIPLCFLDGLDKESFALTLKIGTAEAYTISKLGYDTEVIAEAVENQLCALRERSLAVVREIDPLSGPAEATRIARLVIEGVAAPIHSLLAISPSFVSALEEELVATSSAEYCTCLKELCNRQDMWIGFKKTALQAQGPSPYRLFLIIPSPCRQFAAVEFSESDSATFVYRTEGDFENFARRLNRALEATAFKREVIRLSDEELCDPTHANYLMASKRTAALRFIRSHFVDRVIHTNPESWKKRLLELWQQG